MKKILFALFAIFFVCLCLAPSRVLHAETELKAIGFLPKDHKLCAMIPTWINKVNAELKGTVKINWVGGPEIMAAFNQPEAVRKGIFQVGFLPAAYYSGILPEADAISLSRYNFKKEREKGGIWDYMV
jgi:TRAP-type transport system periplasmic protein